MRGFKLFAAAACLLVGAWWFTSGTAHNEAFAEVLRGIREAKSMTWKSTSYVHMTSADGKRTWIETRTHEEAYMQPGLYRSTSFDDAGNVERITVTDSIQGSELRIDPQRKEATLAMLAAGEGNPRGPFAWVGDYLDEHPLEFVERKPTDQGAVNVFRIRFYDDYFKKSKSYDFWIDAKTKRLVKVRQPSADLFDPEATADRLKKPEGNEKWVRGTFAGSEQHDIVYNAQLDSSLFSLEPPEGYSTDRTERPTVTEEDLAEWLGALARFYGGTFPDTHRGLGMETAEEFNRSMKKDKKDRTEAERTVIDLFTKYHLAGIYNSPAMYFVEDKTVEGSFRYIGKGVPLGAPERLVCWYALKETGQYRAIYGDLKVTDVTPDELPLPLPVAP